jgi:hypothetical protein
MDIVTVSDRGREGTDDPSLLAEATADERVLLTNDQDFLALAAEAAARQATFAPIFFWPQQQRRVGDLVNKIVQEANHISYADASSRVFFF